MYVKKFYLDTSIWRDYFEDRKDNLRPLGEFAFKFLSQCKKEKSVLVVSETVILELKNKFSKQQIKEFFNEFKSIIKHVFVSRKQYFEAKTEWVKRGKEISFNDVLHAIIAKDNNATVITRDKHFDALLDIVESKKPEEIIFG